MLRARGGKEAQLATAKMGVADAAGSRRASGLRDADREAHARELEAEKAHARELEAEKAAAQRRGDALSKAAEKRDNTIRMSRLVLQLVFF